MKFFLTATLLVLNTSTSADFGLISDKDGYVNLREEMKLNSKVIGRVSNNEVISCILEKKSSKFCFVNLDNGKEGYIYKDRVNFFKDYSEIILNKDIPNNVVFKGDNIEVSIYSQDLTLTKKDFIKSGEKYYLGSQIVWGVDNAIPNNDYYQLSRIEIKYNGENIIIPYDILKGYFFPKVALNDKSDISQFKVYLKGQDLYLLNQFNSGGAATYNVVFHIKDYKLKQIKVWSEEV